MRYLAASNQTGALVCSRPCNRLWCKAQWQGLLNALPPQAMMFAGNPRGDPKPCFSHTEQLVRMVANCSLTFHIWVCLNRIFCRTRCCSFRCRAAVCQIELGDLRLQHAYMFANSMAMVWVPRLEGWLAVPQALPPPPQSALHPEENVVLGLSFRGFQ